MTVPLRYRRAERRFAKGSTGKYYLIADSALSKSAFNLSTETAVVRDRNVRCFSLKLLGPPPVIAAVSVRHDVA